jgi:hypothetical protein
MANGWTEERRQRQRELIQNWKPWEKSTGAKTPQGKARSSRNAYKYGSAEAKEMLRELGRLLREEKKLIE